MMRRFLFERKTKVVYLRDQGDKVKRRRIRMLLDMVMRVGGRWDPYEGNKPTASTWAVPSLPFH
jgi:hypothetical protein